MGHTLTHDFGFLYSKSIQYHTISCLWQVSWSSGMYNPIHPCSRRCTSPNSRRWTGHSRIINLSQGMYNCKTLMLLVSKRQHCIIEDVLMSKLFSRMIAHRWFSQLQTLGCCIFLSIGIAGWRLENLIHMWITLAYLGLNGAMDGLAIGEIFYGSGQTEWLRSCRWWKITTVEVTV